MRKTEVFESSEMQGDYYIQFAKDKNEAWEVAIAEYPQILENYKKEDLQIDTMYRCLDCQSYWISDDVCGECGEYRLSKVKIPVYKLEK